MEVILIKPMKKVGQIGNLVNVKNGFGRNWLIPQGFAIRATEKNKQLIEAQKQELIEKNNQAKDYAQSIAQDVDKKELVFVRQSAPDGRLFGSVNNKEIARELSSLCSHDISASTIHLDAPLKSIGVYEVEVHLHHDVTCSILITIARSASEAQQALSLHKSGKNPKDILAEEEASEKVINNEESAQENAEDDDLEEE